MKYCSNCGNKFNETDKFCSNCGKSRSNLQAGVNESIDLPLTSLNIYENIKNRNESLALNSQDIILKASIFRNDFYKCGFINKEGNWVIQPLYDDLGNFDDQDYCSAQLNEKWGFINRQGNWVIQPIFDSFYSFDDKEYCKTQLNEKWGFINRQGNWVIQPLFDSLTSFDLSGFCGAQLNEKWGFLNEEGNWVIHPLFDSLTSFELSGLCGAQLNDKWGFINKQGNWVIQPIFDTIGKFDEKGFCFAGLNDKFGFIDRNGNWKINPIFDIYYYWQLFPTLASFDENNLCKASINEKYGLIDRQGNWAISPYYDDIKFNNRNNYIIKQEIDGVYQFGIINSHGSVIIEPTLDEEIKFLDNFNIGIAQQQGKYGLINEFGNWLISPRYYLLEETEYSYIFKASENNKYGFIDTKGNWIINPLFDYTLKDFEGDNMIWDEMSQEWCYEKHIIDYNFERYFDNIDSKVYITEKIPTNKLKVFASKINLEFEDESQIDTLISKVYFDQTIFGKGDNGILITQDDDNYLRIFLVPSGGYLGRFYLNLIDNLEVNKSNLIIKSDNETFTFSFPGKENIINQIKLFFDDYFSDTDDNEDYKNNDNNDPLGLRD